MSSREVDRREFLTFLVAAPVLTVGAMRADPAEALPKVPQIADAVELVDVARLAMKTTENMVLIEVAEDGTVSLLLHRTEVGQGITTAMAMVVAEELGLQPSDVKVPLRDAAPELQTNQLTMASTTVPLLYEPVRRAAAGVRERLVAAAAEHLDVPALGLVVKAGTVTALDGRSATFAELTVAAATLSVQAITGTPKPAAQHTIIGKPTRRIDAHAIVTGQQRYTMDVDVPGALPTTVRRPPTTGGSVRQVLNQAAVSSMPGVVAVVTIPTGVAVVANTFGQALAAAHALQVTWNPGPAAGVSDSDIEATLRSKAAPLLLPTLLVEHLDFDFYWNLVSFSPMEVSCAVADVRPGHAEIWSGLKVPIAAQNAIATAIGYSADQVTVHVMQSGGSFGRRLFHEAAVEAAQVSQAIGRPVKLMWSRTDETRHGRLRPASLHRARVVLAGSDIVAYEHHVSGVRTDLSHGLGDMLTPIVLDKGHDAALAAVFEILIRCPYNFGVVTATIGETDVGVPTTTFRAPWTNVVRPVEEMIVDAIAQRLGKDPYRFRRQFLVHDRARAVLDKVAADGNWGRSMPPGHAQGIAVHEVGSYYSAWLVEIDATNPAEPRVYRAIGAVDVGLPINPSGIEQQMMGGLSDAISTVLQAGIHYRNGLPLEASFSDYHWARQRHFPQDVRIHVMPPTTGIPSGAAEHGLPGAAGAIANAYARATRTAPRRFPIDFAVDFTPVPAA